MWGIVILGLVIILPCLFATITWDSDFPIEFRVGTLIIIAIYACVFIPPTFYRLYLKYMVRRGLYSDEEAYGKCKRIFGEGLSFLVYLYCMDDWFFKEHKKDINEFMKGL